MKESFEWAQDQNSTIGDATPVGAHLDAGVDVKDAGRQLHAVLAQLWEGEALDLIQNFLQSNGWEAHRVLSRRFDSWSAGRRRNIMSHLLQPGCFDRGSLNSAIARWEEKVRLY